MASITDCVVEALKYPFNDVKKVMVFGALFAVSNLISIAMANVSFNDFKIIANSPADLLSVKVAQVPATDIYLIAAFAIVSFLIYLLVMGYQYKVVKFAIDKRPDLPDFADIADIFKSGIKYLLVSLAYNIIPLAILMIGVMMANDHYIGVILIFISFILFIIAFFLLIMALNNMIAHDSLAKAFDFREIIERISNLGWLKYVGTIIFALIVFIIVMVAVGFVLSFLTAVLTVAINQVMVISAVMSVIEGLFITSYSGVFYNRVFGSIYRESLK
ncbi:DUF4013 domain-containing protein [Methanobrevibacter sp.]